MLIYLQLGCRSARIIAYRPNFSVSSPLLLTSFTNLDLLSDSCSLSVQEGMVITIEPGKLSTLGKCASV